MGTGSRVSLGLPRARHIKHGRDFQRTKAQGRRLAQGCLMFNWIPLATESPSRVGVIAARAVGGAVVRTRARRLLRECFRLNQHRLARPVDLVLVARASIANHGFHEVQNDFLTALRRAGLSRDAQDKPSPVAE